MARNRKYQSAVIRFGPALKAVVLCLLIGGSGVGYVWQKDQLARLGQQIKQRERHLSDLGRQNERCRQMLAEMRSPRFLERRIRELNLGLGPPMFSQVFTLVEGPAEPAEALERAGASSNGPVLARRW
jgi:hypothetical protein